jgi:hypothetical protein
MFDEIEKRIKQLTFNNSILFQKVLTAVDPDVVMANGAVKYDTAFLVDMAETSNDDNDMTMYHSQSITHSFAVVIAVRSLNDRLGSNVNKRLANFKNTTRLALTGWSPDPEIYSEINFVRGETLSFLNGGVFWLEEYKTDYLLRGEQ